MVARHDWITLYANGIRYLEKAPLLYWSMAASFRCFGVHTWSARLPLALYTLVLLLAVFTLGRRWLDDVAGFYAALVLATSFGLFIFTRILIPDAMVCLWLTLAMLCFWRSLACPTRANAAGFAIACALGVLTKGLIGLVFPLLIVLVYLTMTRNLTHLRRWHPLLGALIFFAIAAPWHMAAGLANPTQGHPGALPTPGNVHGFYWFYFVNEHLLRYLNRRVPRDYDTVPLAPLLGTARGLDAALERVPAIRLALRAAAPLVAQRAAQRGGAGTAAVLCLGGRSDGLLQLLHAAGVLRAARDAGAGAADRRLAGAERAHGHADGMGALRRGCRRRGSGVVFCSALAGSAGRSGGRAEHEPRRLRALLRPFPRPEHAGDGVLSCTARADGHRAARGHRRSPAAAPRGPPTCRDCRAGCGQRAVPGRRTYCAGYVFAGAVVGKAGGCDSSPAQARAT